MAKTIIITADRYMFAPQVNCQYGKQTPPKRVWMNGNIDWGRDSVWHDRERLAKKMLEIASCFPFIMNRQPGAILTAFCIYLEQLPHESWRMTSVEVRAQYAIIVADLKNAQLVEML